MILFVEIILISTLILKIYELQSINKHDKILYAFCQIRRDIIKLIREQNIDLSSLHYNELKKLLEIVNSVIHDFNDWKASIFNLRSLIRTIKKNAQKIEVEKFSDNDKVSDFQKKFIKIKL